MALLCLLRQLSHFFALFPNRVAANREQARVRATIGLLFFAALFPEQLALAQRGGGFESYTPSQRRSPTTGFQGFFDTEQLEKGSFSGELFTFSIDYGLTDRLSVGSNAVSLLGLPFGVNVLFGKSRYRFLETDRWTSALSVYAGVLLLGDPSGFFYTGMVTNNTRYSLNDQHSIGWSTGLLRIGGEVGSLGDVDYGSLKGTVGFAGLVYHFAVSESFMLEALVVPVLATSVVVDGPDSIVTIESQLDTVAGGLVVGRIAADVLLNDHFLLTPMLYAVATTGPGGGLVSTPSLNMMFRFGAD